MLRHCLLVNSASCAGFGLLFLMFPRESANFIGSPPVIGVGLTGALLTANAALLALTAWRWSDNNALITFFILGDIGWVLATALLLGFGFWINGPVAITASLIVAAVVGALGYGQYRFGLRNKPHETNPV